MTADQHFEIVPVYSGAVLLGHVQNATLTATCLSGSFQPAASDPRFNRIVECAAEMDRDDADHYIAYGNWVAACEQVPDVSVVPGGAQCRVVHA